MYRQIPVKVLNQEVMYSQLKNRTSEEEILRKKKALEAQLAETNSQLNDIHLNMNKENQVNYKKKHVVRKHSGGKRNKQPTLSKGTNSTSSTKAKNKRTRMLKNNPKNN